MEELDRINIQTTSSERQTLQTVVNNGPINLTTQVSDVPQIQTVLQDNIAPITSVINNPFVEVTSVNGMTGDVITEAQILGFVANKFYKANTLISYEGNLYWAKQDFTSTSVFDVNDWNLIEATGVSEWDDIQNKPTFATVATSGLYNDLSGKPNFATVATSGSYNDLSDQPSINNGSLTIKRNNTLLGSFTANSSSNVDVNVSVPVQISDLINDDNYLRGVVSQTINPDFSSSGIIISSDGKDFYPHSYAEAIHTLGGSDVETELGNLASSIDNIPTQNELIDLFFPVGTVRYFYDNKSHTNFLGKTWVEVMDYDLVAYAALSAQTTIAKSKNISSVTGSGGDYTVNFSKNMADTNYIAFVSGEVGGRGNEVIGVFSKAVGSFHYDFSSYSGSATTPTQVNIAVFGRLATPEYRKWRRTA